MKSMLIGPNGATKLSLGPGLTSNIWDALFGPGTANELQSRGGRTLTGHAGWTRQGWFRKCADVRAKGVSTFPWAIYRKGADNDAEPLWQNDDVSVPDNLMVLDGFDLALYMAEAALALSGQAYFGRRMSEPGMRVRGSLMGRFGGLMYWDPRTIEPKITEDGLMGFKRRVGHRDVLVDPEAVVWAWQPDPYVEVGPGSSDGGAAGTGAAALDSLARLLTRHLDSGLVKMTVLSIDEGSGTMGPEQRSKLRSIWDSILKKGTDSDGGPPLLSGKVTPHTIGDGLKDIQSKEISEEQRQSISTGFGIPWSILTSESANFATAQVEERGFYLRTIIPQCKIIERAFNTRLFEEYDLTFRFEPERHEVMQAWEMEKAEKISKVTAGKAVLTRNEGRMLLGYETIDEWDAEDRSTGQPGTPSGDGSLLPENGMRAIVGGSPLRLPKEPLEDRIARIVGEGR